MRLALASFPEPSTVCSKAVTTGTAGMIATRHRLQRIAFDVVPIYPGVTPYSGFITLFLLSNNQQRRNA